jgi:hypothetical protein
MVFGLTPFEPAEQLDESAWRSATERSIRTAALRFPSEKLCLPGRLFVTKVLSREPAQRLGFGSGTMSGGLAAACTSPGGSHSSHLDYDNMRRHPFFSQAHFDFTALEQRRLPAHTLHANPGDSRSRPR